MKWWQSWRADPRARQIADRHYNRQSIGSAQFVPPGRCVVLVTERYDALWVTSSQQFVQHAYAGAWMCSAFRNESDELSSALIVDAVSATRFLFGDPPARGFVTFVDERQVRRKRDPGRCYIKAGWTRLRERTKGGLIVLQQMPADMPDAFAPCTERDLFHCTGD